MLLAFCVAVTLLQFSASVMHAGLDCEVTGIALFLEFFIFIVERCTIISFPFKILHMIYAYLSK